MSSIIFCRRKPSTGNMRDYLFANNRCIRNEMSCLHSLCNSKLKKPVSIFRQREFSIMFLVNILIYLNILQLSFSAHAYTSHNHTLRYRSGEWSQGQNVLFRVRPVYIINILCVTIYISYYVRRASYTVQDDLQMSCHSETK